MNVALIGASNKPDRYSYKALLLLKEKGHTVFAVHPRIANIDGHPVFNRLEDIQETIDIVTLYVSADISSALADAILKLKPKHIIFNPGAENEPLFKKAQGQGIRALNACTLVLLKTGQFS